MQRHARVILLFVALPYVGCGCSQNVNKDIIDAPEAANIRNPSETQTHVGFTDIRPSVSSDGGFSLDRTKVTTFTENASIAKGDAYGVVVVKGHNATLDISGGSVNELVVKADNHVSVAGGIIKEMYINDNCTALISGGRTDTVVGYGTNTVTIKGNCKIGKLQPYGPTQIIVDSNDVSIETIQYPTKCGCVDQSQKNDLILSGGRFCNVGTGSTDVLLTIIGYNLSKSAFGGAYGYGIVKGRWKDGTDFSINFVDKSTFSHTDLRDLQHASHK